MHVYTQTPLWKDSDEVLHVFSTCPAMKGSSMHYTQATVADKENICAQCVERMESIPDPPGFGGELVV